MVDVDAPHVNTVETDWKGKDVKTNTQAERLEREEGGKRAEEGGKAAEKKEEEGKAGAGAGAGAEEKEAKAKAKAKKDTTGSRCKNCANPVVVGNAVLLALTGGLLGFGAYRKHLEGKLSWKLVGLWTGIVGAFGAMDYVASQ